MTTRVVHRAARLQPPPVAGGQQVLASPPTVDEGQATGQGLAFVLMPVLAGTGSLMVVLTNLGRPLFVAVGLVFFAGSVSLGVLMFVAQRRGPRKRVRAQRDRYLQYLDQVRDEMRSAEAAQRDAARWRHPAPQHLIGVAVDEARRWERRRADDDFLQLRVGVGDVPGAVPLHLDLGDSPLVAYDPIGLGQARQLVSDRSRVPDLPVALPLGGVGAATVLAEPERSRSLSRAVVAQAVAWHAPGDVALMVVRAPGAAPAWEWAKWLPHTDTALLAEQLDQLDAEAVPAHGRLVFDSVTHAQPLMSAVLAHRVADVRRTRRRYPAALLVVLDGDRLPPHAGVASPDPAIALTDLGVHALYLLADRRDEPETVQARIETDPDDPTRLTLTHATDDGDPTAIGFAPDAVSAATVRTIARILAPLRLGAEAAATDGASPANATWTRLVGIDDPAHLDVASAWASRSDTDLLRVPIGSTDDGKPVHLDLKESARSGMGPHGLIVGATGSGKSELLRTLVTSLAVTHHPDDLAMVLADYKGGATFAGLSGLPHCAGMITNLQDDLSLVDRMRDALYGEIRRRQELLKTAGALPNLLAYTKARTTALSQPDGDTALTGLPPLPHLLVIIDEFSELLTARPDFAELFVAIGRIGRSIGIHLLLATQRLELGKIRGLETHLSYRIGLRTFSDTESREAIGTADAFRLPPQPGLGYLKVDTTVYEKFRAAYVSAPYLPGSQQRGLPKHIDVRRFSTLPEPQATFAAARRQAAAPAGSGWEATFDALSLPSPASGPGAPWLPAPAPQPRARGVVSMATVLARATAAGPTDRGGPAAVDAVGPSVLDVVVARLASGAESIAQARRRRVQVHRVWLDPLPDALALPTVLRPIAAARAATPGGQHAGPIAVIGLIDAPTAQRQEPHVLDLAGPGGNLLVFGGPQTGKSVLVRTLVLSACILHTPREVAFYLVDAGGGSLAGLAGLPQVAAVASRAEPDLVRRTVTEALAAITRRERAFRTAGLDSATAWRAWRAAGNILAGDNPPGADPDADLGDVYLVIDGWGTIRDDFDELDGIVAEIAATGPAYGVHTIMTAASPLQIRHSMQSAFTGRLELRLTDPFDSAFGRVTAETLPSDTPGRGLSGTGQVFQTALPRLDTPDTGGLTDDLTGAQRDAVRYLADAWGERPTVPQVRVLPVELPLAALPVPAAGRLPVGIAETDLGPAWLDLFGADPHLLVFGDTETGKTNTLRVLIHQLAAAHPPEKVGIVLVDHRRSLLGAVPQAHQMANCTAAPATTAMADELARHLTERLPSADVTVEQLRNRSWWSGPEMIVNTVELGRS